jgi:hypothetical protein
MRVRVFIITNERITINVYARKNRTIMSILPPKNGVRPIRKVKHYPHYFIFFAFLFCSSSCGPKKADEQGILSHTEMVNSLMNIYIAERKIIALNLSLDSAGTIFEKMNGKVLDSLHVQDSVLRKSYNYYLDRPKELEEIYTALVDSLNLREQRAISKPAGI